VHIQASEASPDQKELILNKKYEDGGNIREAPALTAPRLYTITNGEIIQFLNEEQVDSKGIKWLKVQTTNGIEGWISALIVMEKQ
jgi:Bacterial SH3 domain